MIIWHKKVLIAKKVKLNYNVTMNEEQKKEELNTIFSKDEWTQQELFKNTKHLEKHDIKVVLVDTILKPIQSIETITYNPYEMNLMPKGTVFVFYCDTGKTTKARLDYYRKKLPDYTCISLHGGRGYWRPNYQLLEEIEKNL